MRKTDPAMLLATSIDAKAKMPSQERAAKAKSTPAKKPERKAPKTEPAAVESIAHKPMEPIRQDILTDHVRIELPFIDGTVTKDGDTPVFIDFIQRSAKDPDKGFWLRVYDTPVNLNAIMAAKTPLVVDGHIDVFAMSNTAEHVVYGCLMIGPCKPLIEVTWHDNVAKMNHADTWEWVRRVPGDGALEFSNIDERDQQVKLDIAA